MPVITFNTDYQCAHDSALCLEFANTLDWRIGGETSETLLGYDDLAHWSAKRGLIAVADLEYSEREGQLHPEVAQKTYERALILRETIARIFADSSRGLPVDPGDIALLNGELAPAISCLTLVPDADAVSGFALVCTDADRTFDKMLRPIALSAAELLTGPNIERVRQCSDDEGNGCGFFFIDTSRNKSRRWCSMESCGNRAKARRHYRKTLIGESAE